MLFGTKGTKNPTLHAPYTQIFHNFAYDMGKCMINPLLEHKVFYEYLPMRYEANQKEREVRQLVLDFKNGKEDAILHVASYVAAYLKGRGITGEAYTFVCLPASDVTAHHTRYFRFMKLVCDECGFHNGFRFIQHLHHTDKIHNTGKRQPFTDYLYFSFALKNRKVIVFDDVVTTGCTFNLFCEYLTRSGAEVVLGMALAQSVTR